MHYLLRKIATSISPKIIYNNANIIFQIIEQAINLNKNVKIKGIDWDLVTEYDRKIEDDLQRQLSKMYPHHK